MYKLSGTHLCRLVRIIYVFFRTLLDNMTYLHGISLILSLIICRESVPRISLIWEDICSARCFVFRMIFPEYCLGVLCVNQGWCAESLRNGLMKNAIRETKKEY